MLARKQSTNSRESKKPLRIQESCYFWGKKKGKTVLSLYRVLCQSHYWQVSSRSFRHHFIFLFILFYQLSEVLQHALSGIALFFIKNLLAILFFLNRALARSILLFWGPFETEKFFLFLHFSYEIKLIFIKFLHHLWNFCNLNRSSCVSFRKTTRLQTCSR